jgi:type II secretory pathway pseudopilin PulG
MQGSKQYFPNAQRGVSLSGLIVVLAMLGVVAVFAMKVFPTFIEYRAAKDAIVAAKASGGTVKEMQQSFYKNADINRIDSISGKDLVFTKEDGETDISFAYQKTIPLAGNVSLLIDYAGTTARNGTVAPKPDTAAK